MSGAMRRIGEYLGLLEDTGRYDDDYHDYETADTPAVATTLLRPESCSGVPPCPRVRPCRAPPSGRRPHWSRC